MNRQEFMKQLEELLIGISEEEKEEAIAYYTSYFDDAGEENEESVIKELESPQKVAATIKADLQRTVPEGEYTETGYQSEAEEKQGMTTKVKSNTQKKNDSLLIALTVVLAVVLAPIWGPILGGVIGIIIGLFGVIIGVAAVLFGLTIGFLVGGCAMIGVAIVKMAAGFFSIGLLVCGGGMLMIALGILFLILLVLYCGKFLPSAVRGIVHLCQMPFHRRKECHA